MMTKTRFLAVAGGLLLGLAAAPSEELQAPRQVIDRAVQAHGGAELLAKMQSATGTSKGTFYGLGQEMPFDKEWARQGKDKLRLVLSMPVSGQMYRVTQVVNGDKGWKQINTLPPTDMPDLAVKELSETAYLHWLGTLVPLQGQGLQLAAVEPIKLGEGTADGVRVTAEGHAPVNLYFDRETGLLVKLEQKRINVDGQGRDSLEEFLYRDHKTIEGLKWPTKIEIRHDGKLFVQEEVQTVKMGEKLDATLFAEP